MIRVILLARKPLGEKSIAENCLKHGTGGINIDQTRIAGESWGSRQAIRLTSKGKKGGAYGQTSWETIPGVVNQDSGKGRWPANLVLQHKPECSDQCIDRCPVEELGNQSGCVQYGNKAGGYSYRGKNYHVAGFLPNCRPGSPSNYGDRGTAARFFKQVGGKK